MLGCPKVLSDTSMYPNIFAELIKMGWKNPDLAKLSNGNLMRVFRQVEKVKEFLMKDQPNQSWISVTEFKPIERICKTEG